MSESEAQSRHVCSAAERQPNVCYMNKTKNDMKLAKQMNAVQYWNRRVSYPSNIKPEPSLVY